MSDWVQLGEDLYEAEMPDGIVWVAESASPEPGYCWTILDVYRGQPIAYCGGFETVREAMADACQQTLYGPVPGLEGSHPKGCAV